MSHVSTVKRRRPAILIGVAATALVAAGLAVTQFPAAAEPAAAEPFRVYLSPAGTDTNAGLSPEQAVRTLDGAENVIKHHRPAVDVEVLIAPGLYQDAKKTSWDTYLDDHKISFLPVGYVPGSPFTGERPVFQAPKDKEDGASWFNAADPTRATRPTEGLHFHYLEVRNYASGMSFSGGVVDRGHHDLRLPAANGNNHNSLFGMKFQFLGDRYNWNGAELTPGNTAHKGTHAVALRNSNHNSFRNNHFLDLVGVEDPATHGLDAEIIHAFYVKDGSTGNTIEANNFGTISGSPLKIRNDASGNTVTRNRFTRTGTVSDGVFYDRVENFPCTPKPEVTSKGCDTLEKGEVAFFECPSHGNQFTENTLKAVRDANGTVGPQGFGGDRIPTFKRSPYGPTQVGKAGCDSGGQPWLTTRDNVMEL
ncbi:hypothetical protein EV193_102261 [Herbihabitans rhizosphaerae]|uniref:Parallel beta helix pectate lyase-like protein n=1 Tax=Herbihabitans rhizosphaerae TaxID=1872711 RepID=A0A4Q7L4X6_9PSEU|nr:hypothetical protein [Herbihabitans rhizosphaerae]RZS43282.1 hypothetical protein EV193_102261 [Herbihabitans rhizosphaerae]